MAHFREYFLHPHALGDLLQDEIERRRQAPDERRARLEELQADVKRLDGELVRLADAVATGGEIRALVDRLQATQRRRDEAAGHVEHLAGQQEVVEKLDVAAWVEEMRELFTDLARTLEADPQAGRGVLRGLLATPITLTPVLDERGRLTDWDYMATGAFDQLVAGRLSQGPKPLPQWPCDLVLVRPETVTNANTTELVPPG